MFYCFLLQIQRGRPQDWNKDQLFNAGDQMIDHAFKAIYIILGVVIIYALITYIRNNSNKNFSETVKKIFIGFVKLIKKVIFFTISIFEWLLGFFLSSGEEKKRIIKNKIMLEKWNPEDLAIQLVELKQNNPSMIGHYLDSVKTRFINNQDAQTAEKRNAFLRQQIDSLKLANQFADLRSEAELKGRKHENAILQTELENQTLRLQFEDEHSFTELKTLDYEDAKLERALSIARKRKELEELNNPLKAEIPPLPKTPQEIYEARRESIQKTADNEIASIKNRNGNEYEIKQIENMRNKMLNDLREEYFKNL